MKAIVLALDGDLALHGTTVGGCVLDHVLRGLKQNAVVDVVICTHGRARELRDYCIAEHPELFYTFVEHEGEAQVGTTFGLYLAMSYLDDELLVINGNFAVEPRVLREVLRVRASCLAIDWDTYDEDSHKVAVRRGHVLGLQRDQPPEESFGRFLGVIKIAARDLPMLKREVGRGIERLGERREPFENLIDRLCISGTLRVVACKVVGARWEAVHPQVPGSALRAAFQRIRQGALRGVG